MFPLTSVPFGTGFLNSPQPNGLGFPLQQPTPKKAPFAALGRGSGKLGRPKSAGALVAEGKWVTFRVPSG